MKQKIVKFDLDPAGDWRAGLACGHYQHVRHDPPLISRPWVTTKLGRDEMIGEQLDCRKCREAKPRDFEQ
jgi:hypothetical protein